MPKNDRNADNLTMFDMLEPAEALSPKLDVVKLSYISAEAMTWQELFQGYDELRAITFSSGINFLYALLEMFEKIEIIFGNEMVMSYSVQEIMAYQSQLLDRIRDTAGETRKKLLERIDNESVRLFVARQQLSHEKIYLLKAADGRKRVIMGSANMSYNAFSGKQRENISCIDDESAYDWYLSCFEELKAASTDEISRKAIITADAFENIDALPISESVKAQKAIVIEPSSEVTDDIRFVLDTHNLSKKLTPIIPKGDKKKGRIVIAPDTIARIRRARSDEVVKEREIRSEYPQLNVDVPECRVTLNGEKLNLSPSANEITHDVDLFLKYMEGYSKFHGDYVGMQYRYFEFANWFFCSPFMATMRDMAARFDQNKLPYPVFGLVYGQSKAGKTSFLETLLKMMIGQKPKVAAPEFTRSNIESLKHTVQGAPIIVDDLTQTRFNQHAIETIKNDDFGISDHLTSYSAVVISANEDVKAVAPEVIRRTVICRVEAGLTNTEVMQSNVVRTVQQKIGTAFYREYLRKMLEIIPDLIESMKSDEAESTPDILAVSSKVIVGIFEEHYTENIPKYIRELSLVDYFGEHVTGKHAKETVKTAWRTSPKLFVISKRANELRYNAGTPYEADRLIKELPETLEARKINSTVIMNLKEANAFFGVTFKKRIFPLR
ncbi:MAG: NgoFVII family restriction endonuclease [Clostridia bacterium]|nr:NgoFVII family restriction endonuclease [Clostridia bacterium]